MRLNNPLRIFSLPWIQPPTKARHCVLKKHGTEIALVKKLFSAGQRNLSSSGDVGYAFQNSPVGGMGRIFSSWPKSHRVWRSVLRKLFKCTKIKVAYVIWLFKFSFINEMYVKNVSGTLISQIYGGRRRQTFLKLLRPTWWQLTFTLS